MYINAADCSGSGMQGKHHSSNQPCAARGLTGCACHLKCQALLIPAHNGSPAALLRAVMTNSPHNCTVTVTVIVIVTCSRKLVGCQHFSKSFGPSGGVKALYPEEVESCR